ncbi:MAG: DUF881 domain-containing protein [Acetivibrionales bacterium]|jgi:uncharacterized protein YlxW (UPF0749 family)
MKIARTIALTLICIILGTMIAWQYKSINYNQEALTYQNRRVEELKNELITLQKNNNDLSTRLQELTEENRELENAKAGGDELTQALQKRLDRARVFAGFTDVKGKGIIITIENTEFASVDMYDIFDVINELRAAGAQAISVNDERIVATSEVREAGSYIMINGVQMEAPFVIKAISDPDKLERSLTLIDGIVEKLERWERKVSIKKSDEVIIPKVRDDGSVIKIDLLTPVEE